VFILKVWLAFSTEGEPDISAWRDFLAHIRDCGVCVYETGGLMLEPRGPRITPFNHPPFMIHYLRTIGWLSSVSHVEFAAVFRVVTSCVDLGSAFLVYKLLHRTQVFTPIRYVLYLLAPVTIIISGYHGNTDTVMIFFVLLAAFLIEKPVFAGLAFGLAISIKVVPIIFIAAFIFYLPSRDRLKFLGAAAAIACVFSLPFIVQDPETIVRQVLGYGSFPGRWGWTRALFAQIGPSNVFWLVARLSAYLLLAYIWYLSFKMGQKRVPLFKQLGVISFVLIAFTPSWGTNYMSWLDPFPGIAGALPAVAYYATSGAFISKLYFVNPDESTRLSGICWLAVLLITLVFLRQLREKPAA
jgi:hypothetical protein